MKVKVNIDFENIVANNIMVPKHKVEIGYNNGDNVEDYIKAFNGECGKLTHTYIPVMNYYYQEIDGYVIKNEIMDESINKKDEIQLHTHDILEYNQNAPISVIFKDMIKKKEYISAIYDEYDNFVGIVTLEDVVGTIRGFEVMEN